MTIKLENDTTLPDRRTADNTALKQMAGEVAVLEFSAFLYLCSRLTSEALLFAICFKPETVICNFWKKQQLTVQ